MSSSTKKNLYTFSVFLLSVRTGTQIGENVWQYLYIQRVISQPSFAQFTSTFRHNSYFLKYFLAVIMKSGNSKKNVFVTLHLISILYAIIFGFCVCVCFVCVCLFFVCVCFFVFFFLLLLFFFFVCFLFFVFVLLHFIKTLVITLCVAGFCKRL